MQRTQEKVNDTQIISEAWGNFWTMEIGMCLFSENEFFKGAHFVIIDMVFN